MNLCCAMVSIGLMSLMFLNILYFLALLKVNFVNLNSYQFELIKKMLFDVQFFALSFLLLMHFVYAKSVYIKFTKIDLFFMFCLL